jgi:putative ABC transport system permease protein
MFLALREMRRAAVRFGLLVLAVALLVFLILIQQALQDGLITSFVGGIRNQSAPVLVYSVDGQRTLQGSIITPDLEDAVVGAPGVGRTARLGQSTFTVRVGDDGTSDAAVVGSDDPDLGRPDDLTDGRRPMAPGEAVGSDVDFTVGDEVTVVPAGADAGPVTLAVVGVARDVQISVTPTVFTDFATYADAVRSANPDATDVPPNAIAVQPADGVAPATVVEDINAADPEADALTRADAADEAPGVAQVRQSFQVIFLLYGLVVPLVTGLFFLIVTLQKARSLVLLRAVGARAGVLARALLVQVTTVVVLGLAVGVALYAPLTRARIGGLALRFDPTAVAAWSALLLVLGLVSALVSVRRVLRIEPVDATMGPGVT